MNSYPNCTFGQISDDALAYSKRNRQSYKKGRSAICEPKRLLRKASPEELTPKEIDNRFASMAEREKWAHSTFNHYRSLVSLSYRGGNAEPQGNDEPRSLGDASS